MALLTPPASPPPAQDPARNLPAILPPSLPPTWSILPPDHPQLLAAMRAASSSGTGYGQHDLPDIDDEGPPRKRRATARRRRTAAEKAGLEIPETESEGETESDGEIESEEDDSEDDTHSEGRDLSVVEDTEQDDKIEHNDEDETRGRTTRIHHVPHQARSQTGQVIEETPSPMRNGEAEQLERIYHHDRKSNSPEWPIEVLTDWPRTVLPDLPDAELPTSPSPRRRAATEEL